MSGNNVLYGAGMLECGMVVDYAQLLLDSDIIDMVNYMLQGVDVSDETLEVYWLKSETERVPNGKIQPGKQTFITTTIGHEQRRFDLVHVIHR